MLTDRFVRTAPAGMHSDGGGLYLRVSPKGKRVWVHRIRTGGKDKWVTIGTYPQIPLAQARVEIATDREVTMDEAIALYMSKLTVRRPEQVVWLMKPLDKKSLTICRADLLKILQTRAMTAPVMANRMLTRWKDFFNFCEQQGWIEANPLTIVQRKFVGGKEKHKTRTLSWHEINQITSLPLLFILLTGLRPSEALWVLRTKQTDNIPTKTTPHWIPRTRLIHWALNRDIAVPSSHLTLSNYLRRKNATYTPHDLRRTFTTMLNELGVAPHVVEKLVNHKLQGVMAVYNHAEYREERIAAQKLWERELLSRRKKTPD